MEGFHFDIAIHVTSGSLVKMRRADHSLGFFMVVRGGGGWWHHLGNSMLMEFGK